MKNLLAALTVAAFVSPVFAADMENKTETTVDTSKNPITGTETTTKKTTMKKKDHRGMAKKEVTEKTKKHTDGKVEKSTDVEQESETK